MAVKKDKVDDKKDKVDDKKNVLKTVLKTENIKPIEVKPVNVKSGLEKITIVNNVAITNNGKAKEPDVKKILEKSKLDELIEAVLNLDKEFKSMKNLIKLVQKENDKKEKILKKERDRKEKARLSPSGFAKPTDISTEMCDFIKIPHGTLMSRTEVTKNINAYVSLNNLKDPVNGRIIRPDPVLKKLLRVSDGDEVTFFHMQRLLNPHIKPFKQATVPNVLNNEEIAINQAVIT